jgi:hypothetical protein
MDDSSVTLQIEASLTDDSQEASFTKVKCLWHSPQSFKTKQK